MSRFYLIGNQGETPLRYELVTGSQFVGRTASSEVHLPDAAVSRKQAVIRVEEGNVIVEDLQSLNGTFINEEKLTGERTVFPGDKIRFGHLTLTLVERELTPFTSFSSEENLPAATLTTNLEEIREKARENRSDRILAALTETGQMLSQRLELEELYEKVMDLIGRFITTSRVMILEGELVEGKLVSEQPTVLAHHIQESDPDAPLRMSQTMLRQILEDGQSFLTAEGWTPTESMVRIGVHAAMGVPLFDNDRILGAIYVDSRSTGVTFNADDLSLLTLLGNMVAVKITNSRLEEEERKLENLQRELAVAARIQTNLLPQDIPEIPGYELFCHLAPCEDVGGDLYDVRQVADGSIWLSLGDVTGHGIGAALLMSNVMAGLQLLEDRSHDPVNLVARLEDHLGHHFELGQYVTLFAGILNPETGRLLYVNAGHNPPIVLAPDGERQTLESTGTPVAILPGSQSRGMGECILPAKSTLLIFSDGVCETSVGKVQYDEGPMQQFLDRIEDGEHDATSVGKELLTDVERFRGNLPVEDDLTLLVLRRH